MYVGLIPFTILIFGILIFSIKEYLYLVNLANYKIYPLPIYITSTLIFFSAYLNTTKVASEFDNQATAFILTLSIGVFFIIEILRQKISKAIERIAVSYFGVFLLSWCFSHLVLLRDLRPNGMTYTFYLFLLIWLYDTASYAFGSWFGKRKLAIKVSPKKTWEGMLGGLLASTIFSLFFWNVLMKPVRHKIVESIILGLVLGIFAQFSDLCESLLKRECGVKDTDNLLPGHGGMLDRFDSFLFTAPIFYYFVLTFHR